MKTGVIRCSNTFIMYLNETLTLSLPLSQNDESNVDSVNNVTQHSTDDMIDKWTSRCDSKSWKKIKQ